MNSFRRLSLITAVLVPATALFASADMAPATTSAVTTASAADNTPVATIGSTVLTQKQMMDEIAGQLSEQEHQIYKIKKEWLHQKAKQILFTQAAAASGASLQDWQTKQIDTQSTPTSAEVDKACHQYFPNETTPSSATVQKVTQYLTGQKRAAREEVVYHQLALKTPITITLARPKATRIHVDYSPDDPVKGPKNAPVTIVEFTDYQCPYCKNSQAVVKQVEDAYKGKIKIVTRNYPLPMHDRAKPAAEAAMCALEQDKYWQYRELLFPSPSLTDADFKQFAKSAGLNEKKFDACVAENRYASRIDKDVAYGQSLGVNGTPQFYINGESMVGAQPFDDFSDAVDAALADAQAAPAKS